MNTRFGLEPTVPWRTDVPKGLRSSQYMATNGFVCAPVGRQSFDGSLFPEVLLPNSIQPFEDSTMVV